MIKLFNKEQSRGSPARPDWPENPSRVPTLFSARKPLRKLRVLVDAEVLDIPALAEALDKSTVLVSLLQSEVVEFYRYTDGLPAGIEPTAMSGSPHPAYAGWAVAYPFEASDRSHWPVVYSTDPTRSVTFGGVTGNVVQLARTDDSQPVYTDLDPEQQADRCELDALALQVAAQAVAADVFITHRPYLYSGSPIVSAPGVTVCTRDDAIPLIALYLRAQREFVLPTVATVGDPVVKHRFGRGLYYWVGARELLPEAWRWFSACVQHSSGTGNEKLTRLGGSLLSRVTKALLERDEVHMALNQPANNDTSDEALGCLDNVLLALMGAVDVTARVAHYVLNVPGSEYDAAWQRKRWFKQIADIVPALAAAVGPGTPGEHALTILRLLRNSVHGAALEGITYLLDGNAEIRIGLPVEDEAAILAAMDATGGRMSWGVRSITPGLNHVQPALLVDRLFETVLSLLNDLMNETPVETLPAVTLTAADSNPPVENPPRGNVETFSEWNRLAIRWQLGF